MQYTNPRFQSFKPTYQGEPTNPASRRLPTAQPFFHPAFETAGPTVEGQEFSGFHQTTPRYLGPGTINPRFQQEFTPQMYAPNVQSPQGPFTGPSQTPMRQPDVPAWGTGQETAWSPSTAGRSEQTLGPASYPGSSFSQEPFSTFAPQPGSTMAEQRTPATTPPGQRSKTVRQPPVDLFDEGENLVFEIELPGVTKDEIELVCNDNGLSLKATVVQEHAEDSIVRSERGEIVFQRYVPLDIPILPGDIEASFEDGILTVTAPKKEPTSGLHKVAVE